MIKCRSTPARKASLFLDNLNELRVLILMRRCNSWIAIMVDGLSVPKLRLRLRVDRIEWGAVIH